MAPAIAISITLIILAVLVAYRRGGPPERLAATIIVTWMIADVSYHLLFGKSGFDRVDPVHVVLDGAALVAMVWLALRANRMWTLWAAAAQLMCVMSHLVAYVEPGGMRRAYWAMTQLPPYIQLLALVLGAVAHARRFERIGPYRSWRFS